LEQLDGSVKLSFFNTVSKVKRGGGSLGNMIAWIPFAFSDSLKALVTTFDGSNLGYEAGKKRCYGSNGRCTIVETDDALFPSSMDAVICDKRAVIRVTPKMDPATGSGMKLNQGRTGSWWF